KIIFHMLFINMKLKIKLIQDKNNYLWPLINEDWKESIFGKTSIQNILWSYLIEKAMITIPRQHKGLYLCENQGWERAFIYYWKKHGHGELIAVQHSTVRYWDLRYFDLDLSSQDKIKLTQPLPDKIAVNGNAAWKNFKQVNKSMKKMIKVEALRYLHLNNFNLIKNNNSEENSYNILLLGDYDKNSTESMLKLLDTLALYFKNNWKLTLKPHPANPIKPEDWPNLEFEICDSALDQILPNYKIAISSIYTSASLEAYCAGLKIISVLDDNDFNFSPMRNVDGAIFVSKASELKKHLGSITKNKIKYNINSFFWLDNNLSRWRKILNLE
ncbi:hypothetical protein OAA83_01830, partial [Candidatus Marinimicrobia bacterium]|nr:hypothetical protein [Candidatus Neomarinimicrobiota bacterium]